MKRPGSSNGEFSNSILFFSGKTVSVFFSSVYAFVIGLYVLRMTGSGLSYAVTISIQILPVVLVSPFAGVLADRLNKKYMIIFTDLFSGMLFIVMYLAGRQGLTVSLIYPVSFLASVSETLFNICMDSSVPNLVSRGNILRLNSVSKIIDSGAAVISPGLGGLLFALVDIRLFILINAVSFLFSAFTECLINFSLYAKAPECCQKIDIKKDIAEGVAYIRNTGWIISLLVCFVLLNFFMGLMYSVPLPCILNNVLHLPSNEYGMLQSAMPVGMIAGALMVKKVTSGAPSSKRMSLSGILFSVCMFFLGLYPAAIRNAGNGAAMAYYAVFLLIMGILVSLIDIPFIYHLQNNVPEDIRGRVLSISISLVKTVTPVGYMISGALIGHVPPFAIPLFGSVVSCGVFLMISRAKVKPGSGPAA
ncbi:MAG: MFS transporter [Clostridia bacterium]|nr:MFS transporter [Clostridia bacterium]MDR3644985.1 MFS transporter [Clostridia bacterium]